MTATGALSTFGMVALTGAPRAHADIENLVQPIVDTLSDAANAVDGDSLAAPALAAADSVDAVGSASAQAISDLPQTLDGLLTSWYQTLVDDPLAQLEQEWVSSPFGQSVDSLIDSMFTATGHAPFGDGAPAGTAGAASWLFGDTSTGAAASSTPTDLPPNSVPLEVRGGTDPVIQLSVNGGRPVDAVVDTGSAALAMPWYDIGSQVFSWPSTFGVTGYAGGLGYLYADIKVPVDFGDGMVTAPTDVHAVLAAWPTQLANIFNPRYYSLEAFQAQAGYAPGILGMGPNVSTLSGDPLVSAALPGDLSRGVLIDEPDGYLQFGPNPLDLTTTTSIFGAPITGVQVSIDDGPLHKISAIFDTGGLSGYLPESVVGSEFEGDSQLPPGTLISVYDNADRPLYSYTTTDTDTPLIRPNATSMVTGNPPFAQQPIYVDNNPPGKGILTFGDPPK
ncbi:MAG TPA: PecA family PE domain-processing aspartic protease [Mycobacterium sp.]|nr:PecA family PE domain-processing aspartic protease [Mycobacterium sp.]